MGEHLNKHAELRAWPLAALARRLATSDSIKSRFYPCESRIDERLKFVVGENIRPIVLDAFSHEFADVSWINALRHTVLQYPEGLR